MVVYPDDMDIVATTCLWLRNTDLRGIHGKTYSFNDDNKRMQIKL